MNKDLELERNKHNDLKKTWELANTHFIMAQDQLKSEIEQLQHKLPGGESGDARLLLPISTTNSSQAHRKYLSSEALDVAGVGGASPQTKYVTRQCL